MQAPTAVVRTCRCHVGPICRRDQPLNAFDKQIFRRLGWGAADQAFSSITNFTLGVAVARIRSPQDFGAFSIAFATYTISFGLARALTSEVLAVRFSAGVGVDWRRGTAAATGVAIVLGAIIGVACLAVGAFVSGPLGKALLVLGSPRCRGCCFRTHGGMRSSPQAGLSQPSSTMLSGRSFYSRSSRCCS